MQRPDTQFFTISDPKYFVGTVALVNSLRVSGRDEPITVLDCGFDTRQRALLEPHCRLVPFDPTAVGSASPAWMKAYPYILGADGSIVIIDSDAVVTGGLDEVLDASEQGRVSAITGATPDRWFREWEDLFHLSSTPRHQPYVSAAFVAFSTRRWPGLLSGWWSRCQATWGKADTRGRVSELSKDPVKLLDQDVLNGLLMTELPRDALDALPRERGPAGAVLLEECTVQDVRSLRCTCKGMSTLIVHHSGGRFPWHPDRRVAWRKWSPAYVALLRRLLFGSDVPIRLERSQLPLWLHATVGGRSLEQVLSAGARSRYAFRKARRARKKRAASADAPIEMVSGVG